MEDQPQVEKTDFYCIPVEVIDGYMLPHLEWNDLLRLRRVCRWTKAVVHGFIRLHPELAPELEINLDNKTFGAFLKMGIPTTRIFLNNASGLEFYKRAAKSGQKFLEQFGPLVKHLQVEEFPLFYNGKETLFLDALKNLESMKTKIFKEKPFNPEVVDVGRDMYIARTKNIPDVFKQDYLRRSITDDTHQVSMIQNRVQWTGSIQEANWILKYEQIRPASDNSIACLIFSAIQTLLDGWSTKVSVGIPTTVDFASIYFLEEEKQLSMLRGLGNFETLCDACIKHDVKLLNVSANWFQYHGVGWNHLPNLYQPHYGTVVYSLVNLHPGALRMEMPNLEKIEIRSSHRSNPGVHRLPDVERSDWPALKVLEITMDSGECGFYEYEYGNSTTYSMKEMDSARVILDFFFKDVDRPALVELRLHFTEEANPDIVPESEDILTCCPNLKKLTLVGWPGTNAVLSKLWCGLPCLEEVSFEDCKDLGNQAFVGEDVGSPAFLNLMNLKKLSLKKLDKMPKVTDKLFTLVIRHMPLTYLTLTSSVPLKSVTLTGIRSLLDGKFAESVEKFSFQDWSLANVSTRKWNQLKSKFRSSHMI